MKKAKKITKPIQLLAVVVLGLLAMNALFLKSASELADCRFLAAPLVIASIANVYILIYFVTDLLKNYRDQLQDDKRYSKQNKKNIDLATGKPLSDKGKYSSDVIKLESALAATNTINLNELLPEYKKIKQILSENDIPVNNLFGGGSKEVDSKYDDVLPFNLLTYGFGFDIELFKKILILFNSNNVKNLYISHSIHAINKNMFYIGSYAYLGSKNYRILSGDMMDEILNKNVSKYSIGKVMKLGSIEAIRTVKKQY
ncbi:hypothetical protein H206_01917 [Candidatus Electrothrix aarhusensis]|uniref:Uncharacterized protein n=1 Tax=Candidatus Electrothrix aarhusensis TaxID=1859131 RepID=A0A3S3U9D4_9BACT|nr:hypothetical protein H206_01917 [Candidatus Electrothrix aarhusensis]